MKNLIRVLLGFFAYLIFHSAMIASIVEYYGDGFWWRNFWIIFFTTGGMLIVLVTISVWVITLDKPEGK